MTRTTCFPRFRSDARPGPRAGVRAEVPADFAAVSECLPVSLDRRLGYLGQSRYVMFGQGPGSGTLAWSDGRSAATAPGAWRVFSDEVGSMAESYGADVLGEEAGPAGDGEPCVAPATHVLVLDRTTCTPYFAPRRSAEQFLARRAALLP